MKKEFLNVYERSVDGVFLYFYEKSGNREDALKRTQEVFTKTWDSLTDNKKVSLIRSQTDEETEKAYGYRAAGVDHGYKAGQYKFQN